VTAAPAVRGVLTNVTVEGVTRGLRVVDPTLAALSAAIGKTGARTRAEAVRLAEENGWL
jgi:two-component system response regulator DesR